MSRQQRIHRRLFFSLIFTAIVSFAWAGHSIEQKKSSKVKQQMQEGGKDAKRASSKSLRGVKDKSCEMIHGKLECAAKKTKHSIQNTADELEDKVD